MIRPEDISLIEAEAGLFKATVDSLLFRGVHYEICCVDRKGYEWVIQTTKRRMWVVKLVYILNQNLFISWFQEKLKRNLINVLKAMRILMMSNIKRYY